LGADQEICVWGLGGLELFQYRPELVASCHALGVAPMESIRRRWHGSEKGG
jgi:hypothetical protein